jgi:hypothetical protein
MSTRPGSLAEGRLSPIEAGLLTVAERRGRVSAPAVIDERNDPSGAARFEMLTRLSRAGLMARVPPAGEPELWFGITEAGRAALALLDAPRA